MLLHQRLKKAVPRGILGNRGYTKVLRLDNINENVLRAEYAVRGELYKAAVQRTKQGKEVIYTNIGNPHSLGQKPVTFTRQVLALVVNPGMMEDPSASSLFPPDVISRAKMYLKEMSGGMGAYSDSKGVPAIRQEVADFIQRKSGQPSSPDNVYLLNGASESARLMIQVLIRNKTDGILVPIPQYPLYSASIALYGGQLVPYFLNESQGWSLDVNELKKSIDEAKRKNISVKGMVFINPGNPTGQSLTEKNLADIMKFAHENSIVLMADEVYQENIYNPSKPFISARKVLGSMPRPISDSVELVSMHSTSKGVVGECGLRGGYMEVHNVDTNVAEELYKLSAINLCSNLVGQVAVGLMCNPPRKGDPSFPLYDQEVTQLHQSLQRRAARISAAFNALPGVSCQQTEGALYSFPSVKLPASFVESARMQSKAPDVLYCLELLDATGLCTVPGSGFKQAEGTFHFRTTILPAEDKFDDILKRFSGFQQDIMKRWG